MESGWSRGKKLNEIRRSNRSRTLPDRSVQRKTDTDMTGKLGLSVAGRSAG